MSGFPCRRRIEAPVAALPLVGRGTDHPFEQFGAPWLDARKLSAALNAANLPGVRFVPVEFTPMESKSKGQRCRHPGFAQGGQVGGGQSRGGGQAVG